MDIPTLTTQQMVEVDRLMIEEFRISLVQMMENAGRNLAELAHRMLNGKFTGKHIVVLCGAGNNGGGGMVAARHLHNRGGIVTAILTTSSSRLKDIPVHQWNILKAMGIAADDQVPIKDANLIIDAMIGYGLQGNPRGTAAEWIKRTNEIKIPVLSLDTPSGLDTTSGKPGTPCVKAETTMTLALPKTGLMTSEAKPFVGDLYLADISVPPELYQRIGLTIEPIFADDSIIRLHGQ
jgi:NAD(P)H-hydrate epimerase